MAFKRCEKHPDMVLYRDREWDTLRCRVCDEIRPLRAEIIALQRTLKKDLLSAARKHALYRSEREPGVVVKVTYSETTRRAYVRTVHDVCDPLPKDAYLVFEALGGVKS